jgi:putative ABC transport system permease protein
VEKTTSQLFVASLHASCCALPVQIIGFDQKTDFVVLPWLARTNEIRGRELADSEIVIGSKIVGKTGSKLSFFGQEFTIAARLEETGMGFDSSVFLDIRRARRLLVLSDVVDLPVGLDKNTFVSSTLVKVRDPATAKKVVNVILQKHAIDYGLDFVLVAGMVSDIAAQLRSFSLILYGFSGAVWLLASGVLALVFSVILQERNREFALLRIMGATKADLACLIFREAFLISAGGALLGLSAAAVVFLSYAALIKEKLLLPFLRPDPGILALTGLAAFFLALLTGPLASLHAAWRVSRLEVHLSLREEA